ncbi:hypothetical protein NQZ68_019074 [Dissostichus eleginoides]|nr:hypothetical protein NQZ68_019074 [Dissostichus eleginoides]
MVMLGQSPIIECELFCVCCREHIQQSGDDMLRRRQSPQGALHMDVLVGSHEAQCGLSQGLFTGGEEGGEEGEAGEITTNVNGIL